MSNYEKVKEWKKRNPNKVKEQQRRWREKHKSKKNEYLKEWRKENPEKLKEQQRRYREKHREEINKRARERSYNKYVEELASYIEENGF